MLFRRAAALSAIHTGLLRAASTAERNEVKRVLTFFTDFLISYLLKDMYCHGCFFHSEVSTTIFRQPDACSPNLPFPGLSP